VDIVIVGLAVAALFLVTIGMFRYLTATGDDRDAVRRQRINAGRLIRGAGIGLGFCVALLVIYILLVVTAR
jgi:hypothetical protein